MTPLITGALLALIEQAGANVLTLVEGLEPEDLLRSRLTRAEVQRQLCTLADSAGAVDPSMRERMPELGWDSWEQMQRRLRDAPGAERDEALLFACNSLVPATLLWLRVYAQNEPALFQMRLH